MLRNLLTLAARHGRPGALVRLGTSGGKLLYLEAAMQPVSVVAALERDDVVALVLAATAWLRETEPGGGEWTATPCLCTTEDRYPHSGRIHSEGGRCNLPGCPCLVFRPSGVVPLDAATVQFRTVARRPHPAEQGISR